MPISDNMNDRFFVLTEALERSSHTEYFSASEKTCIHQERAAIMKARDSISITNDKPVPQYRVPEMLNKKILKLIKNQ